MASLPKYYPRVMETSTTTGTGTYTLGGAVTGYQAWSVLANGNSAYYLAMGVDGNGNPNGDWEEGLGTWSTGGTLTRDVVLNSSNAGAAVNWAAGTRRIFLTLPAELAADIVDPGLCEFRLTALTGVAVPFNDVTAAGTIYLTPYGGNRLALYTGNRWKGYQSAELSLALTATSGLIYDVFVYDNAGTLTLETTAWRTGGQALTGATNATPIVITATAHGLSNGDEVYVSGVVGNTAANGTWVVANVAANTFELTGSVGNGTYTASTGYFSARVTALALQDGVYVKTGATTRRYVGTFKASGSNVVEDSVALRYVWNAQNRVRRLATKGSNSSHTYNSATARNWNADATLRCQAVIGANATIYSYVRATVITAAAATAQPLTGIALDWGGVTTVGVVETALSPTTVSMVAHAGAATFRVAQNRIDQVAAGHHFWQAVEAENGAQTSTFSGIIVSAILEN